MRLGPSLVAKQSLVGAWRGLVRLGEVWHGLQVTPQCLVRLGKAKRGLVKVYKGLPRLGEA